MTLSSVRPMNQQDASVYAPLNGCSFIPNCAFERMHSFNHMPNGVIVRNYLSDNSLYIRVVVYPGHNSRAIAGALISRQTNELIHIETSPPHRRQGIARSLLAIYESTHRRKLWAAYAPPGSPSWLVSRLA